VSAIKEKTRLVFIKSPQDEYIEAVNSFMKWITELLKKDNRVYVEVRGRETVLAEGYCRIELYTPERITLSNGEYAVSICGRNLELRHLSLSVIAVDGRIDGVEFV